MIEVNAREIEKVVTGPTKKPEKVTKSRKSKVTESDYLKVTKSKDVEVFEGEQNDATLLEQIEDIL